MSSQAPTFNLKAVIKETGLKPDTLRAWERRYGLPQPERTSSGHRLYSQRDIEIIKWLIERQNEGLSIGRAVDLWRIQEAEGQDPLVVNPPAGSNLGQPAISAGDTVVELRQSWIAACLNFDETRAEYVLTQAFALYPPEVVCMELIQKGLAEIGQRWYQGEVTVQQEHFTSALGMRRLETLVAATATPVRPGRILVAAPPEELHTFSLLLVTLLLRRRGWEVVYLGANVPLDDLAKTIKAIKPHLVILGSQQLHSAATLLEAAKLVQQEQIPLGFGGLIFNTAPQLRQKIPGVFLGERIDQVSDQVDKLFATPYKPEETKPLSSEQNEVISHYQEKRGLIEANIWEQMKTLNVDRSLVSEWNQKTAANINAALVLNDGNLLSNEIYWGKDLLINHELPEELLNHYVKAYLQGANAYLDERAKPILNWLDEITLEME